MIKNANVVLSDKCSAIRAESIISFALGHSTRVLYIMCVYHHLYINILTPDLMLNQTASATSF